MTAPIFIAGDWGTSRLRLYLCEGDQVIGRKTGPGAVGPHEPHEAILFSLIEPWLAQHPGAPVVFCGMVGSRNGWVEAPYAPCPAGVQDLGRLLVRFDARGTEVAIVPGVVGASPRGAPDVMRGEETQIMGALAKAPELGQGRHLLAHPGTHTKWAVVEDGRITGFQTALTGEMFALLRDYGTLARVGGDGAAGGGDGFAQGLVRHEQAGRPGLLHELFEVRSRQLIDGWDPAFALDFLSGLLIAADVEGAIAQFGEDVNDVVLVGDPLLTERYRQALDRREARSRSLSGEDCALAGLAAILDSSKGANHVAR